MYVQQHNLVKKNWPWWGVIDEPNSWYDLYKDQRSALVRTPRGTWRPPTNYNREIWEGDVSSFNVNAQMNYGGDYLIVTNTGRENIGGYYFDALPGPPQYLEDGCITQCLLKLKDSNINLSQSFGERKQTARLVRSNLDRMTELANALRRRNPRAAWEALKKDPHELWLELQYGVRPLVGEIYGAVKELNQRESISNRVRVTVSATRQERFYSRTKKPNMYCGHYFWIVKRIKGVHNVKVRLDYVQNDNVVPADLSRLGITNPLLLAWELMPWSFVVDWFVPIGQYFNTLDAAYGWQFLGGSVSKKSTQISGIVDSGYENGGGFVGMGKPHVSGSGRQMLFSRTTYGSSPLPSRPYLNKAGNAEHVANGIALFSSAMNRLFG